MTTPTTPPTTPPDSSASTVLRARSPKDLLAVARVVLGFEPADSVVMLTTGAVDAFHARVDLPDRADGVEGLTALAEVLLSPARRHAARTVVLVLFSADHRWARRVARTITQRIRHAGIECLPAVRAHAGRWHPLDEGVRGIDDVGVPYDVSTHPFVVSAVLEGRVIHGSREELAATLLPDPDAVAHVEAARAGRAGPPGRGRGPGVGRRHRGPPCRVADPPRPRGGGATARGDRRPRPT